MASWALQDAKAKLSEVIDRAIAEGPQHVSRHGKRVAVVTAVSDATEQTARHKSFVEALLAAPQAPEGFELTPMPFEMRDIDFGQDDFGSDDSAT